MIRTDDSIPDRGHPRPPSPIRSIYRLFFLLVLVPGCAEASSHSIFSPASPNASAVTDLFWAIIGIAAVIFVVVEGALFYALFAYRARPGRTPGTFTGNPRLEIIWTAIPAIILAIVFALTASTVFAIRVPTGDPIEINAIAHQWWWEFDYAGDGFITANALHVPVGETVVVHLSSGDVIHSFWPPSLTPKWDAIPGRVQTLWFSAQAAGVYQGNCSEFCGVSHAWMYFPIQAEDASAYQSWVLAQKQPPPTPTGLAAAGQQLYQSQSCRNCHAITGSGSTARVGPNLTHVGSRPSIGGGVLTNTPQNMYLWLEDPGAVKPGVLMPNYRFNSDQLNALTAYMESLR
jgi:cytochrome c oxidase subunit 2